MIKGVRASSTRMLSASSTMGNNPSVLKCLPESEDAKKLKWLEERCTQLAIENERLHQKVREAQLTTQGGSLHGGSALTLDNAPACVVLAAPICSDRGCAT